MRGTLRIAIVALATTWVAGCGGVPPRPYPETAETLGYRSVGMTAQLDCGAGKSLDITGSNNTLTVVGACWSVQISGADNRVRAARIDGELTVTGLNNTVAYREGDPVLHDGGSGNRIARG